MMVLKTPRRRASLRAVSYEGGEDSCDFVRAYSRVFSVASSEVQ